jgi:hypothetical protein
VKYYQPYIPLTVSGDEQGNVERQAAADRINSTTNRMVDGAAVVKAFEKLLRGNDLVDQA